MSPEELFFLAVRREFERARKKFPEPDHLTLALAEECGEAIKAICDYRIRGISDEVRLSGIYGELIQTAAMCVRLAVEGDPTQRLVW